MAVLPIYTDGSPVLRQKAKPLKQITDQEVKLIIEMFETMRKANGIGLAANQVGILKRIIVIDVSEVDGLENIKPLTLINPIILEQREKCIMEEGCLSVPDVRDEIERSRVIKIKYNDTNFKKTELEASDLLARVIQHEIDHLNGILFIDYLPSERKKYHLELLEKIHRGELDVQYPIISLANVTVR